MKLIAKTFQSKAGKMCSALILDTGYTTKVLSWDRYLIAELLDVPVSTLNQPFEKIILKEE